MPRDTEQEVHLCPGMCLINCCNLLKPLLVLMVNYLYVVNILEVYFPINRHKPEPDSLTPCGNVGLSPLLP